MTEESMPRAFFSVAIPVVFLALLAVALTRDVLYEMRREREAAARDADEAARRRPPRAPDHEPAAVAGGTPERTE